MPLFDQTIPVSAEDVSVVVFDNWKIKLGPVIKASQNHTFQATYENSDGSITKYVVRVTPNPLEQTHERIKKEIFFVNYLAKSEKLHHICAPVPNIHGEYIVRSGDSSITVSEWAKGAPLDFMSYRWMTDKNVGFAWGKWLAEFHIASRQFSADHPEAVRSMQRWDQVHSSILEGSEIHSSDQEVVTDSAHYGVLHGDLNMSNFFYDDVTQSLSAFDWDQAQQGWYLMDLAQAELAVWMLHEGGSLVDGSVVAEANPQEFEQWLVDGYESVAGWESIDRNRLSRMVQLRKQFYERFCRLAVTQGDIPKDMEYFVNYVVKWFDKLKEQQQL